MFPEIAAILLGACAGAIAAIYAADAGYLGNRKMKAAAAPVPSFDTYVTTTEQAPEVPAAEAPAVAEPAPSPTPEPTPTVEPTPAPEATPEPSPAIYETVQPAPAPVTFAAPSASSFAAPTLTKPTRTYRRRTAPVRSAAGSRKALAKPKKR